MLGTSISYYRIISRLGAGGMGVVYLAEDTRLKRRVALKTLPEALAGRQEHLERFRREAQILARLNHPNIVTIYTIEEANGLPFLTMELIEGRRLTEMIPRTGLPLERIFEIGIPLADGLAAAHGKGITHRDLKPGNIMVTDEGRLKILDFGLAKLRQQITSPEASQLSTELLTEEGRVMGTWRYMSPEQLEGGALDPRSDIFSLGVILYEMATGARPFQGSSSAALATSILTHTPLQADERRTDLPHHLGRIIRRCLEKDPDRRYQVARDLENELVDLRQELSERHAPTVDSDRSPERRWRVAWWRLAALAALLALVLVPVIWLTNRQGIRDGGESLVMIALVTEPLESTHSRISPDGEWLSFASGQKGRNRLWLRRVHGGAPIVVARPAGFIESHVWSPDGEEIAFTLRGEEETLLQTIPAFGGEVRRSFRLPEESRRATLLRWVDSDIYLASVSGLLRFDLTEGKAHPTLNRRFAGGSRYHFDVRHDGRKLAFCVRAADGNALWVSDLDGGNGKQLTNGEFYVSHPRWMGPAGGQLVFSSTRSGQVDLWRVSAEGGSARQLTSSSDAEVVDDAARDGSFLTFTRVREMADLWAINHADLRRRQLTHAGLQDFWPSVARGAVAFQRSKPRLELGVGFLDGQIFVAALRDLELREARLVVDDGAAPLLSPDGDWLAFLRASGGKYSLWLRELASSQERQVTDRLKISSVYQFPWDWVRSNLAWEADGRSLFFVAIAPTGEETVSRLDVASREAGPEALISTEEYSYSDLYPSPDGRWLAYVRRPTTSGNLVEIRCLDLTSTADHLLLRRSFEGRGDLYVAGWLHDSQSLIVIQGIPNPDWTEQLEVLTVDLAGATRTVGAVGHAFGGNAVLDTTTQTLFLTKADDEGEVHNLYAFSTAEAQARRLTENRLAGVTFLGMEALSPGALLYSRHERRESTWMVQFADPTTSPLRKE